MPHIPLRRFQFGMAAMFLFFVVAAILLGFWTLRQRQQLADLESLRFGSCPVALHVIYHDASNSAPPGIHQGTATYVFKNRLPIKIKIAFPPISCVPDNTVPFAYQASFGIMPDFFRKPQLVELPVGGEVRFKAAYTFTGKSAPAWLMMFGNPTDSKDKELVLTPVQSTAELR